MNSHDPIRIQGLRHIEENAPEVVHVKPGEK